MMHNIKKKILFYCILIFFLSFGLRLLAVAIYVSFYDTYESDMFVSIPHQDKKHAMIEGDARKYYINSNIIANQISSGHNPFLAGTSHDGPVLYQRIIALYALISGKIQLNTDKSVPLKQIYGFFVVQSLLFSFCLIPFFIIFSKIVNFKIAILSSLFLAIEPTVVQYSSMMLTEAIFVALILLAISLWVRTLNSETKSKSVNFVKSLVVLGILLGLIFLQRPVAVLLPIVFIIAIYVRYKCKINKPFIYSSVLVIVPFALILVLLGFHNYGRANLFYIIPTQAGGAWESCLANYVVAKVKQSDPMEEKIELLQKSFLKAKEKGIIRKEVIDDNAVTEYESYQLSKLRKRCAFEIFLDHPIETLCIIVKHSIKSLHINPFHAYLFNSTAYKPKSKVMEQFQERKRAMYVPVKIAYSLLILLPAMAGWFLSRKVLPVPLNVLLTLYILYFPALSGWLGNSRYIVPNLVPYAIYWSICLEYLINWVKIKSLFFRLSGRKKILL